MGDLVSSVLWLAVVIALPLLFFVTVIMSKLVELLRGIKYFWREL